MRARLLAAAALAAGACCGAERVALSPLGLPYLQPVEDAAPPVDWAAPALAALLQRSALVEVSARGIRGVRASPGLAPPAGPGAPCAAAGDALCVAAGVVYFPSFDPADYGEGVPMRAGACAAAAGRRVAADAVAVAACDVLEGAVVVYAPRNGGGRVWRHGQAFGPMAYLLVLLSCAVSVAGVAAPQGAPRLYAANAGLCGLVCLLRLPAVPFLVRADAAEGLLAAALCVAYAAAGGAEAAGAACLHALDAAACALYRTPETPYAPILCAVFAARLWRLLLLAPPAAAPAALWLQLAAGAGHLALLAATGARPQFARGEDWPPYAVVGLYLSYCGARHSV